MYVVDDRGQGLLGQRVKVYGASEMRADREGCAPVVIKKTDVTIYDNGHTAYNGYASRLGASEVFARSGGRP